MPFIQSILYRAVPLYILVCQCFKVGVTICLSFYVGLPIISDPPKANMTVNYGGQLSLNCSTAGLASKYTWYLNGEQLFDNTDILQRDNVDFNSDGIFQCYAYSEAGNDSFATFVNVFGKMKKFPPTFTLVVHSRRNWICRVANFDIASTSHERFGLQPRVFSKSLCS